MKLLFIIQNYYPSVGGSQTFFQKIAEGCVRDYGDEVTVITTNSYFGPEKKYFKKIEKREEFLNQVRIIRFPYWRFHLPALRLLAKIWHRIFKSTPSFLQPILIGPFSLSMKQWIAGTDADLILAGTCNYLYLKYPRLGKGVYFSKPFVIQGAIHFKEQENSGELTHLALKAILSADIYLANTIYEKERLKTIGVADQKIEVTGCGVDPGMFSTGDRNYFRAKLDLQETDILIGFAGRIESTKGIDVLINAFCLSAGQNKNIYLILAGYENPLFARNLRNLLKSLEQGIQKKIHIYYNISELEKAHFFKAIDIFILPSVNESFGIVFLEAWACRKPVIGAAIGAVASIISEGEDGLLMQPGNPSSLSEKILLLAADRILRERIGQQGFQKVMNNFTWDLIIKKCREIFQKLTDEYAINHNGLKIN